MEAQKPGRKECKKSDICRTVDNLRHKKLFRLLLKAEEIGSNASIKIDKVSMTPKKLLKKFKTLNQKIMESWGNWEQWLY